MRVVIAEDSVLLRAGLIKLLETSGFEVAAAVGEAEGLLAAVRAHRPDAAIVDVRMPPGFSDEGVRAALVEGDEIGGTNGHALAACQRGIERLGVGPNPLDVEHGEKSRL